MVHVFVEIVENTLLAKLVKSFNIYYGDAENIVDMFIQKKTDLDILEYIFNRLDDTNLRKRQGMVDLCEFFNIVMTEDDNFKLLLSWLDISFEMIQIDDDDYDDSENESESDGYEVDHGKFGVSENENKFRDYPFEQEQ